MLSVFWAFFLSASFPAEAAGPKTRNDLYKLCTQKKTNACLSLAEVVWQDKTPESRKIGMKYLKYACSLKNGAACDLAKSTSINSDWKMIKSSAKRSTASTAKKKGARKGSKIPVQAKKPQRE